MAAAGRRRRDGGAAKRRQPGAAPPRPPAPARPRRQALVPLLAALAPLLLFWHTTGYGFLLDDGVLFQKSASLHDLGSIPRGFATDVGALRKGSDQVLSTFYRPVFLALSTLYYQAVGGDPFGWHFAAVAVAALIGSLVALLFLRLGFPPWPSLLAACVFSLHPAHVSSVAWATGLQEQLAALFVLLAVYALLRPPAPQTLSAEREWRPVAAAAAAFALALFSKEVSIALLPMVAVWALARRRTDPAQARRFGRATLVFAGIVAAYLVTRVAVLGGIAKPAQGAPGFAAALPSVPLAFVTYLRLLVAPTGFSFFRPERPVWSFVDTPVLVSAAIVAGLAALAFVAWRRQRELLLPLAWFVVWLLPVLNFWALSPEWMITDRYLFLPSLALPWVLLVLLPRRFVVPTLAALALAFAALSLRYAAIFRDERTFYAAMERAEPTSSFVQGENARLLLADGKRAAAEAALRRAVELDPREPALLRSLGDLELGRGDLDAAEEHYRRAVAEEPAATIKSFKQLALALAQAGQGERAAALVEESARRWPADFETQLMHAVFLGAAGDRTRAAAAFAAAERLRPGDPALAGGLDATVARLAPMLLPRPPQA